jgi:hypothetical protein
MNTKRRTFLGRVAAAMGALIGLGAAKPERGVHRSKPFIDYDYGLEGGPNNPNAKRCGYVWCTGAARGACGECVLGQPRETRGCPTGQE